MIKLKKQPKKSCRKAAKRIMHCLGFSKYRELSYRPTESILRTKTKKGVCEVVWSYKHDRAHIHFWPNSGGTLYLPLDLVSAKSAGRAAKKFLLGFNLIRG